MKNWNKICTWKEYKNVGYFIKYTTILIRLGFRCLICFTTKITTFILCDNYSKSNMPKKYVFLQSTSTQHHESWFNSINRFFTWYFANSKKVLLIAIPNFICFIIVGYFCCNNKFSWIIIFSVSYIFCRWEYFLNTFFCCIKFLCAAISATIILIWKWKTQKKHK